METSMHFLEDLRSDALDFALVQEPRGLEHATAGYAELLRVNKAQTAAVWIGAPWGAEHVDFAECSCAMAAVLRDLVLVSA